MTGRATQLAAPPEAQLQEERLRKLSSELRCLVCQNQTIADSNAGLALDLRATIREQIHAGQSDQAIRQMMVERYGEFILYDPPWSAANALLWSTPLLLVLAGAWLLRRLLKANRHAGADTASPDAARLEALEARYRRHRDVQANQRQEH